MVDATVLLVIAAVAAVSVALAAFEMELEALGWAALVVTVVALVAQA
jgi:hypothetical protein